MVRRRSMGGRDPACRPSASCWRDRRGDHRHARRPNPSSSGLESSTTIAKVPRCADEPPIHDRADSLHPKRLRVVSRDGRSDCGRAAEIRRALQRIEIDGDPGLEARFGIEVPVLFVNDRKAFKYRCTPAELRKRLAREAQELRCRREPLTTAGDIRDRPGARSRLSRSHARWSANGWRPASISSDRFDRSIDGATASRTIANTC